MINLTRIFVLVSFSFFLHFLFYNSEHLKKVDYATYDFFTYLSTMLEDENRSFYTVIVDIDEKSLHELGQWPWPRVIDAKLIEKINEMNPSAIGVNIVFPEKDRVSMNSMQEFYKEFFDLDVHFNELPDILKDNDLLLSDAIEQSNATLPIYFSDTLYMQEHCKNLRYKKNTFSKVKSDFHAVSLICNNPVIQNNIENFGFMNASRDEDGIFRRIPLFMNYNKRVFPSFAMATLLSFDKYLKVGVDSSTILVKFSKNNPKVFSAVDILNNRISLKDIQGKIVIIGSSIVGLNPTYNTPNGKLVSNSMIHAFAIDNILSDSLMTQPKKYKFINILISFLLSLFIIFLFEKRKYFYILLTSFFTILISLLWGYNSFLDGIYISIGYFWILFLYMNILLFVYYLKIINEERQEQEKILIRQSKLASMGEMIALIAHQWRQPLSSINGITLNIDMDHRKDNLDSKILDKHLNDIEETTAYLSKTINDFTDFFSQTKKSESFYLNDIIPQVMKLAASEQQRDMDIVYMGDNIHLVTYKSELIQSLLILLNNAIYACRENLERGERGLVQINAYVINKRVFISVEDNGGGIEIKDRKKIFNPYYTTKDKAHGTGLGLYILKLLVEDSMNGKITVHNGRKGALFTIEI